MKSTQEIQQRRNRVSALTLMGMGIFSLAMVAFAYLENVEAKKQRELSSRLKEELVEMEKIANQNQKEAMMQRTIAEERERMAQKAFQECKQNHKSK